MAALDLYLHLTASGCQLTGQGDRLRVHDPHRVLTDPLRQQIRQHKQALLALLAVPPSAAVAPPAPLTPHYPCVVCGKAERWDDAGIWRCMACWPPPLTEATRLAERNRAAMRVISVAAPVPALGAAAVAQAGSAPGPDLQTQLHEIDVSRAQIRIVAH